MLDYALFYGTYALSVQDMLSTALFFPAKTVHTFQNRTHSPHRTSPLFSPIGVPSFFFCCIPTEVVNGGHNTV